MSSERAPIRVPPSPGPSSRSANMKANRRRDTSSELSIRRALHAMGRRFRVDLALRPDGGRVIRPDIVFTRRKVAVFVDGCYWHGCPEHGRRANGANASTGAPRSRATRNATPSRRRVCGEAGWRVLRVWEHEDAETAVRRIIESLDGR